MVLVDSSAWIAFLRSNDNSAAHTLREYLRKRSPLATTGVVIMEVMAGAKTSAHAQKLGEQLAQLPLLAVRGFEDFKRAAEMYRVCRSRGATIRKLMDCLIAAIALRHGASILHLDRDFSVLAKHTALSEEPHLT